jgi:geranylgeranyl diphosphate synthase, type II
MSAGFERYLDEHQAKVESLLRERWETQKPHVPERLFEAVSYSLYNGGKRLRPMLCLAFAEAASGHTDLSADAACAVELIHTYSLIHDDLPAMDDDDLRRGRPTSHKTFGEAMAILAGDALLTEAFALLGRGGAEAALIRELAEAAGAAGMVGGQVLDIAEDRPADPEYLLSMHALKTGRLLRAACRLGVLSVKGTQAQLAAATVYGDAVGLAFQIADDVLDVTSTSEALGKPAGADAAAGRHTFPALFGLERSRQMARDEVSKALAVLSEFQGPAVSPLEALARYVVERQH